MLPRADRTSIFQPLQSLRLFWQAEQAYVDPNLRENLCNKLSEVSMSTL
ncbi:hypothetical protein G7B40_012995 [Aetokthonos hydrillicola Thurmond2011]|uniref:Uncharacterized protein n=1 Tax=Aetokthonos hydrillicola Thurmond2011 TaxID=2712845 RepID=A0AAP5I5M7_9CYAN|nr:hypothetical protein [Aetokthonos hydrillicola CCALA 1050]MDR9895477.1 hypothetical protein [Aetokthonos hydrillicola Thurmond2011]